MKILADLYCEKGFKGSRVLKLDRRAVDFKRERRIRKNECNGRRDY